MLRRLGNQTGIVKIITLSIVVKIFDVTTSSDEINISGMPKDNPQARVTYFVTKLQRLDGNGRLKKF
jgi:hypothetical protein